jgi:hypothetical protein
MSAISNGGLDAHNSRMNGGRLRSATKRSRRLFGADFAGGGSRGPPPPEGGGAPGLARPPAVY